MKLGYFVLSSLAGSAALHFYLSLFLPVEFTWLIWSSLTVIYEISLFNFANKKAQAVIIRYRDIFYYSLVFFATIIFGLTFWIVLLVEKLTGQEWT
jgi:hypothetical protein